MFHDDILNTYYSSEEEFTLPIYFDSEKSFFHIQGHSMSYIIQLRQGQLLHHAYWGKRLRKVSPALEDKAPFRRASIIENKYPDDPKYTYEYYHYEFPSYGTSDFRIPAVEIEDCSSGNSITDFRYEGYHIYQGKKAIPGLPSTHGREEDVTTLEIQLVDRTLSLRAVLYYHLFENLDIITRHVDIKNEGSGNVRLNTIMSSSVDFTDGNFTMLSMHGTALREREPSFQQLKPGIVSVDSTRGISSHQSSPNVLFLREGADEDKGEVYSMSFVYSGNFTIRAEMDCYGSSRIQVGIQPFQFSWLLEPGEAFYAPEVVLGYSDQGVGDVSRKLHTLVNDHLLRGQWAHKPRPVLINTWEACYFNFDSQKVLSIAKKAKEARMELLVLDDGWFGKRNAANCSLGDWVCNTEKLKGGLKPLVDSINAMGLKFGIWFEPEMISPDSDLYRQHPDWCIHVEGRRRTQWRNQLVLDFSNPEVCEYIYNSLDKVLQSANIEYIKWDHNRRLTELGSSYLPKERQKEVAHRYMLGVYNVLERITSKYDYILFENCASGGARYDYGMYAYFHQGWLSDNTDPVCRLSLQHTSSVFFPQRVITAHVSKSPNEQTGRVTPLSFRGDVAFMFNFGYELDLTALSRDEIRDVAKQSAEYKDLKDIVQNGEFYRLGSSLESEYVYGWQVVSGRKSVACYYKPYCKSEEAYLRIRFKGLDPSGDYKVNNSKEVYGGDLLMQQGLPIDWKNGDYFSQMFILEKVSEF